MAKQHQWRLTFILGLIAAFFPYLSIANTESSTSATLEYTKATLIADTENIVPGQAFNAALRLELAPHWHTYTLNPGEAGMPTTIEWHVPEGFEVSDIRWPAYKSFDEGGITTYGYDGEVVLPVTITPPDTIQPAETITITADAKWLVCYEICIPQSAVLTLTLPVGTNAIASADAALFPAAVEHSTRDSVKTTETELTLFTALFFAFIGGVLLNLMPCVFPVLSMKALAITKKAGVLPAQIRKEGLAYTAGVLVSFLIIAGLLIGLQHSGSAIGWGYQLQSPYFVAYLAMLLFAVGLSLSGMFSLPVLGGNIETARMPSGKGSFFTGVLAVLVATPCTAPFMAPAIGFALTQSEAASIAIFLCLGLGLALPFLLISYSPGLFNYLPKPGAWMNTFKQLLAFPMYASAVWLIWVFGLQTDINATALLLMNFTLLTFGIWLWQHAIHSRLWKWVGITCVIAALALPLNGMHTATTEKMHSLPDYAQPFDPVVLETLVAQGKPVFVEATAAWCITCQINHRIALRPNNVQRAFTEKNITYMVADWTNEDPMITTYLQQYDRGGVPLYVLYPPGKEAIILPQILTPGIVLDAFGAI